MDDNTIISGFPTLYKKAQSGATIQWNVWTEDNIVVVKFGEIGGKLRKKTTPCKGKNIGRKNETSPAEQALKDAQSKWNKKKDREGYVLDINDWGGDFKGMLCKDGRKHSDSLIKALKAGSARYGNKYDGVRSYREGNRNISRRRTVYPAVNPELEAELDIAKARLEELVGSEVILDGEQYIHGRLLQDIQSCVKKKNDDSVLLTYRLYDFFCQKLPKMGYFERELYLDKLYLGDLQNITYEKTKPFASDPEGGFDKYIDMLVELAEADGFEGIIIRFDKPYQQGKKNAAMWKVKRPDDEEFVIVDVLRDKDYTHDDEEPVPQGKFVCKTPEGVVFECVPMGGVAYKRSILNRADIGKMLKVQFFGKTKAGKPLYPTGVCVRLQEDIV